MNTPHLPFLDFLSGALALDNAPVLCDDRSGNWLRYGELRRAINDLTNTFQDGSASRQRSLVLCALPRKISGVTTYLGAVAAGHAVLLIDPATARPDLFITHYEPEWIVLDTPYKPDGPYIPVDFTLPDLYLWQRTVSPAHSLHEDLFLLLLPPGPPEAYKTVRLSYKAVAHNVMATAEAINFTSFERALLQMPLAYSFGLSLLHMALSVGGSLVLTDHDIKSREFWETAQKRDATLFAGVPFHYEYICRAGLDNLHAPRLKTFLQAGGRMPFERTEELLKQVAARQGQLYIMYGLTEAAPRISALNLTAEPDKIGSSGKVLRDGELTFTNSHMIYKGPNVMFGYAESRADLALGDTQQGALKITESAFLDEDGYLFFQ